MLGHATYLVLEIAWALPVLALQWIVGRRTLWDNRRTLALAVFIPSVYLCVADAVAIANGIWMLHTGRIVGVKLGNLPLEEAVFFLATNAMVVQSVLLVEGVRQGKIQLRFSRA